MSTLQQAVRRLDPLYNVHVHSSVVACGMHWPHKHHDVFTRMFIAVGSPLSSTSLLLLLPPNLKPTTRVGSNIYGLTAITIIDNGSQ